MLTTEIASAPTAEWLSPRRLGAPRRIVSLVPSLTEALFMLGLEGRVAGRTAWCVLPEAKVKAVPVVGGTKNTNVEAVLGLQPDLGIARRQENVKTHVEAIAAHAPVLLTDVNNPGKCAQLWRALGEATDTRVAAERYALQCERAVRDAERERVRNERVRCLYFIWRQPWMVAGHGTYIGSLLELCGFALALPVEATRYPRIEAAQIRDAGATALLFSSEPYPFSLPSHAEEAVGEAAAGSTPIAIANEAHGVVRFAGATRAVRVDGQRLSWYPSQTVEGLHYARALRAALADAGAK